MREKAERETPLKYEIYHFGQHGGTKKAKGERGDGVLVKTEASDNPCGSMRIKSSHLYGLR